MAEATLALNLEIWSVPGHAVCIEYAPAVLEEIRTAAVDGYHRAPHGGVEIGGILFGTHQTGTVQVTAGRPIACEYAKGPSFVLSEREQTALADSLEHGFGDPQLAGLEPVGWYRAHNRSEINLSETDVNFFNRFFPQQWQVGLIVRPASFAPTRAGFFFRESGGSIRTESSYGEFALPGRRVALPSNAQSAPPAILDALARSAMLEVSPPPARVQMPEPVTTEPRLPPGIELRTITVPRGSGPQTRWKWYAAAAAVLTAAAALAYWPHETVPGLALSATDTAGQLRVVWDRGAPPLLRATGGSLQILDHGLRTDLALSAGDLRSGSVSYARQSGDVELRLVVHLPGKSDVQEMTHFLKPGASSAAPAGELQNAAAEPASPLLPNHRAVAEPAKTGASASSKSRLSKLHTAKLYAKSSLTGRHAAMARSGKAHGAKSSVARSHILVDIY